MRFYLAEDSAVHQLALAPPVGGTWAVGAYEGATRAGGVDPRIEVVFGGSMCSSGTGRFDVLEVPTFADNRIVSFAADFEHRCGTAFTLHGSIRIGSSVPIKALDITPNPHTIELDLGPGTVMVRGAETPVTITNVGNVPASIGDVTRSGEWPESFLADLDCPASLDPGASCTLGLTFQPVTAGLNRGRVTIASDALRWGLPIPLRGSATFVYGTNPTPQTALTIGSLPFAHGATTGTSSEGSYPGACAADRASLWYRYTSPTKRRVLLDPTGSESIVAVQVMAGKYDILPFACSANTPLTFTAEANVSYWIRVQAKYDSRNRGQGLVLRATAGEPDTTVSASGIGVSATAFFPYVDGYRDTIAIKGVRAEKASVAVSIYSPAGTRVRTFSSAAADGAYSITWNGKNASGTLLGSGKYRIVQTVTDLWGNKLTVTSYSTISLKRLYTYTYTKTMDAAAYSAIGKAGTGTYSKTASSYAGGVRLSTGTKPGAAGLGYGFSVPAATVYKSVTISALGRSNAVTGGTFGLGVHDWTLCPSGWNVDCADTWGGGPRAYAWAGHRVTGTRHVSSTRVVRAYVQVTSYYANLNQWADVRDVKITVVYGILK